MFFMNRPSGFQKNQKLNQDERMVSVQTLACGHIIGLSFNALHGRNEGTHILNQVVSPQTLLKSLLS